MVLFRVNDAENDEFNMFIVSFPSLLMMILAYL